MALSDMSLRDILKFADLEVFSPDGFSAIEQRNALKDGKPHYYINQPYFNIWTLVAGVTGWPSRQRNLEGGGKNEVTGLDLVKNFFGYTDPSKDAPIASSPVMNYVIKPIFFVPLHLTKILFTFPWSIVKLVLEYLPLVCLLLSAVAFAKNLKGVVKPTDPVSSRLFGLAGALFFIFTLAWSQMAYTLGRSITSPFKAIGLSYWEGQILGHKPGGVALALASAALTAIMYFWLWPVIFQAVGAAIVPPFVNALPSVFAQIGTVANTLLHLSGIIEPALMGLSILATAVFGIIGFPMETFFLKRMRNEYFHHYQDGGHEYKGKQENKFRAQVRSLFNTLGNDHKGGGYQQTADSPDSSLTSSGDGAYFDNKQDKKKKQLDRQKQSAPTQIAPPSPKGPGAT